MQAAHLCRGANSCGMPKLAAPVDAPGSSEAGIPANARFRRQAVICDRWDSWNVP